MNHKTKHTVTVVLPAYNRDISIARSISSVLTQSYRQFELLVIDDGSTDSTEEVVKSIDDDRIQYVKLPSNVGAAAARNQGVKLAKGDFIAFQDSDDEWVPDKLEKQLNCFDDYDASVGMVFTDMLRIYTDGSTNVFESPEVQKGRMADRYGLEYQVFGIGQQSAVIRKECFSSVGFFDESLPRFIDLEFFVRLLLQYQAVRISEPLVRFYETEGISSNRTACIEARLRLLEKYQAHCSRKFRASQYAKIAEFHFILKNHYAGLKYLTQALLLTPVCTTIWRTLYRKMRRRL